jgi:hypothetical protein
MCFSPTVSFVASAGLFAVGMLTLRKTTLRREVLFASIPLLFSLQQFIEGLIWLELMGGGVESPLQHILTQVYAVFVGVLWPIIPALSVWILEPVRKRKNAILPVIAIGVGIALYTLGKMLLFPITAKIAQNCISYEYPIILPHFILFLYVIATCAALLISSNYIIRCCGVVNIISFLATYYIYEYDLTSVWCLFAAIASGMIYFYFSQRNSAKIVLVTECVQ